MKTILSLLILFTLSLFAEKTATVKANSLRMRAQAGLSYEVVGLLKKDEKVIIIQEKEEWAQIIAPNSCSAWIAKRHLNGNKVSSKTATLHAGAGVVFSTIGQVSKDSKIQLLKGQDELWQQICAPGFIKVWVKKSYLQTATKTAKAPVEEKAPSVKESKQNQLSSKDEKTLSDNKVSLPTIDHQHDDKLLHKTVKPRNKTYRGYLLKVREQDQSLVDFALAKHVNGHYFPICYLKGQKKELSKLYLKELEIEGTLIYKQGWIRPLLEFKKFKIITTKGSN